MHQEINEQTMQTEHEFFSEQDMIDAGWNEKLGFTKCHSPTSRSMGIFSICLLTVALYWNPRKKISGTKAYCNARKGYTMTGP